jgi:hypothetical protein
MTAKPAIVPLLSSIRSMVASSLPHRHAISLANAATRPRVHFVVILPDTESFKQQSAIQGKAA